MNYSELVKNLADELDLSQSESNELVHETFDVLIKKLGEGKGFTIPDLGTFSVSSTEPKKVYNPYYEKYLITPPKRVVDFSPSSNLKDRLKFERPSNE
ncbi:MAG TPA: HU family DNA-binding protein [Balneolaceae bacterium]|nr:HU family DNA-binding protein [Balneolaceae bacterium]